MLLRRMIEHVRTQNWTAVFLDFVIVVVGILIAFQITSWNDERESHTRSQEYLSRIRTELTSDMTELRRHSEFWGEVATRGYVAIEFIETGNSGGSTEWEILRSFLDASQSWQFAFSDATYTELRSAGELGLIPDAALRSALADYYVLVAARRGGLGPYHLLPEYREMIRGRMRSDILRYYWRNCFEQGAGIQIFVDCPAPPGLSDATEILREISDDQDIVDALRYWIDTQAMSTELAEYDLARAQAMIDRIEAL